MSKITSNKNSLGKTISYIVDGKKQSTQQTVREVENGKHENYHVREMNGKRFIASNPDNKTSNNVNNDDNK